MENKIRDVDAFIKGLKPAFFTTSADRRFMRDYQQMMIRDFPYLKEGVELNKKETCYLFFHTEDQKQYFLKKTQGLSPDSPEFQKELGLVLGYPPMAVQKFYEKEVLKKKGDPRGRALQDMTVGLFHCGCSVQSPIEDARENVEWLWNTYKYDESLNIGYVDKEAGLWRNLSVPYLNLYELDKALKKAKTVLEKNHPNVILNFAFFASLSMLI